MRDLRYRTIAADIRRRLGEGEFAPGRLLPSEADFSREYEASRVTVRRALEELKGEGLVDSRQGFGWFAAGHPLRQTLGRLDTIESQLAELGLRAERRVLDFGFVAAPARAREVLGVDKVLRVRRLNLADGEPFARVTVWVPEALGARLSRADVEAASFYDLLPVDLGGAVQTIGAGAASADDARILQVPKGSPILRCERITSTTAGVAVLLSVHVFPALRTEFVVEMPNMEGAIDPSGLRLSSF